MVRGPDSARRGRPTGPTAEFEAHRSRILDAAAKLFAERGYETAGMRELARAVGMSPAAVYHYFKSKDAIMDALIESSAAGPQRGIRRLPAGGTLREILYSAGAGFLGGVSTPEARARLEVVFLAAHHRADWGADYLTGLSDPTEAGLADAVAAALPSGARDRVEPRWVAKQLIGALLGFVLHEEVLRRGRESAPGRDAYLRQVVDIIATGVETLAREAG